MHRSPVSAKKTRTLPQKAMLAAAVALTFSGCAISVNPLTVEEQTAQFTADRAAMFEQQEAINGPVSLEEAMARAVKYNLDHRLKMMEQALSERQLKLSSYEMLPKLTLAAGYAGRDTELASSSEDIVTRTQSLVPSTSQDKNRRVADLGFTWNILDFGVSYYQGQQNADRTLIMEERRRKVVHSLMQQVRQAYWLAVGAQQMEARIEPLLQQVEKALADVNTIDREKLRAPLETLNYRRQLLDTLRQLESIRDELAQAKPRLAALMNHEPGKPLELQIPANSDIPALQGQLADMEQTALLHRPELIEARYSERISVLETRKAMARLLPGLEFSLGAHYDSNSFLVDRQWNDAGLRISWNLMNVLSGPTMMEAAQAQVDVTKTQRLALNMAVLSQVHIAYRDYLGRKRQYELAKELEQVDTDILQHTRNAARNDAQGRLAEIRASVGALYSELRRFQSFGALHNAYGAMQTTLGHDPLPQKVAAHDVDTLTAAIKEATQKPIELQSASLEQESKIQ